MASGRPYRGRRVSGIKSTINALNDITSAAIYFRELDSCNWRVRYAKDIAAALISRKCSVEYLTSDKGASDYSTELSPVTFTPHPATPSDLALPSVKRTRQLFQSQAPLSRQYDIFISLETPVPVFNHAKIGCWIPDFPQSKRPYSLTPEGGFWNRLKTRWYNRFEWNSRFTGYRNIFVPSRYMQKWLYKYYGLWSTALPPVIELDTLPVPTIEKKPVVCLVTSDLKAQAFLTQQFNRLLDNTGIQASIMVLDTFDSFDSIINRINSSAVLWDATGFGLNLKDASAAAGAFPFWSAYAMALGTIPVAFCCGAVPETLVHQQAGYVWQTVPEALAYLMGLFLDTPLRLDISALCQTRAEYFSRDLFNKRLVIH